MKKQKKYTMTPGLEKLLIEFSGFSYPFAASAREVRRLAGDVKTLADVYTGHAGSREEVLKADGLRAAYLMYYLPSNFIKLVPLLDEIIRLKGRLTERREFALLDLGCGPGTFALSVLDYLSRNSACISNTTRSIYLRGLDRVQENAATASRLIENYLSQNPLPGGLAGDIRTIHGPAASPALLQRLRPKTGGFDLIVAGNVINELCREDRIALASALGPLLNSGGALIVLDPGTREASRDLVRFRDALLQDQSLSLYAPCLSTGPCPAAEKETHWCHEKIFWQPPAVIREIDRHTPFAKQKGVKFSYFTFVKKKANLSETYSRAAGNLWRVVSYLIKNKGEERLLVCNGQSRVTLRRLKKNASELNRDFAQAGRGRLADIGNCLVRQGFWDLTRQSRFEILL